jgi:hypothetical protein
MESIKIKIGEFEFQIKQSFRALMIFEKLTGKSVSQSNDSINDIMMMFYSIIKGCNKNFDFDFEFFVDLVDENPKSIEVFTKYLNDIAQSQIEKEDEQTNTKPTKKKKP